MGYDPVVPSFGFAKAPMQTTIRNLPLPSAEVGRIIPARPLGDEREEHRQPPRTDLEVLRPEASSVSPDRSGRPPRVWENPPRSSGTTGFRPGETFDSRHFSGHRFSREDLLQSASFQAQHLGQMPPYENEALLRVTASDAYRQAGRLSIEYLSGAEPLDITA